MPRTNRVRPDGQLIATPARGLFWGNRGALHDADGTIVRYSRGKNWIICALEFKGRRRTLYAPGRLSELFFLDEATALAAGHRPCGECRSAAYRAFKSACSTAHGGEPASATSIDARLHADRLAGPGVKRTYLTGLATLSDGAMIDLDGQPWLVLGGILLAWDPGGYTERRPRRGGGQVRVLTPRATVASLAAGFRPGLHPTATTLVRP
jgi:hypothetical protein